MLLACSNKPSIGPDDASVDAAVDAKALDASSDAEGDGGAPADLTQSGTRIKSLLIKGSDGSQSIAPFLLDTQTGCFCGWNPTNAQATTWQCAPLGGCDAGPSSTWATGSGAPL